MAFPLAAPRAPSPTLASLSTPIERLVVALALTTAVAACSDSTASGGPEAPASIPNETADAGTALSPEQAACDAETATLQTKIDAAHAKTTNAVLALKDPVCGTRVIPSGPGNLTAAHLHRIGSVTKTYVGAVVLALASEGALGLDDTLDAFAVDVPNAAGITVRQLLTHTSGLFNYTDDATFIAEATSSKRTYTPAALVAIGTKHDPYFAPGKGWHYSNTNYVLLGMIAEQKGGAKISALVRRRILDKLGLGATFLEGEEALVGTLAIGTSETGEDLTDAYGPTWSWAAGAMVATPSDVASWIEALASGTFHDAATQKAMLTTVSAGNGTDYGLGIMGLRATITGGLGPGFGHGGDIPGYHTQAFYFPDKKTTLVAIVDSDADSPNDLTLAAIEVLTKPK